VALSKEEAMSDVHILAIDLAKRSFRVCGTDRGGACVDAPDLARGFFQLLLQHGGFYRSCVRPLVVASAMGPVCSSKNRVRIGSESFVLEPRDWFTPS
jgi:hypothetical protein